MVRYLSDDWLALVERAARRIDVDLDEPLTVQQVVDRTEDGPVAYYLRLGDGPPELRPGRHRRPDVTMRQDWPTAVGIATGELAALEAVRDGRLQLTGSATALQRGRGAIEAMAEAFSAVRAETSYE